MRRINKKAIKEALRGGIVWVVVAAFLMSFLKLLTGILPVTDILVFLVGLIILKITKPKEIDGKD